MVGNSKEKVKLTTKNSIFSFFGVSSIIKDLPDKLNLLTKDIGPILEQTIRVEPTYCIVKNYTRSLVKKNKINRTK